MVVRLLTEYRGASMPRPAVPGELWDLPRAEAYVLVTSGRAVPATSREIHGVEVERR